MPAAPHQRLIVALDYGRIEPACAMARRLGELVGMFKVGNRLFTAVGPSAVARLSNLGCNIFLDLKFHDIPNTVAGAVAAAVKLPGVRLVNLHGLGGLEMMKAARGALGGGKNRPKLLAVTVLTSMDRSAARSVGLSGTLERCTLRLAKLAKTAGLDGVVSSPREVRALRRAYPNKFLIVVPGIRPLSAKADDQARIATPTEAIRGGADYIVVGRPITAARDPRAAVADIVAEIGRALRGQI